jgi:hypothetical protein
MSADADCGWSIRTLHPQDRQAFLDSDDYREYAARSDEMTHVLGGPPHVVVYELRLQG